VNTSASLEVHHSAPCTREPWRTVQIIRDLRAAINGGCALAAALAIRCR
jgi:hypothetical protein